MIRTMTTATNTLNQLQSQLDIIGNNLANSSTHGYKSSDAKFQEMLYQQFNNDKADTAPRQSPLGIRYGSGAVLGQAQMNWKVGSLQTDGPRTRFCIDDTKTIFQRSYARWRRGTNRLYTSREFLRFTSCKWTSDAC